MPRESQHDVVASHAEQMAETAGPSVADAQTLVDPAETHLLAENGTAVCQVVGQVVVFLLAGQRYALPVDRVQEIQNIVAFSEVPAGGASVVGMVNLRGTVIPAIDLRVLVGLSAAEYTLDTPMMVCRVGDDLVVLLVDAVEDVVDLPAGCLQDSPAMHGLSSKMRGVARLDSGLVYVLDLDLLLGPHLFAGVS